MFCKILWWVGVEMDVGEKGKNLRFRGDKGERKREHFVKNIGEQP